MRLTLNYTVTVISACTNPGDTNTFTHNRKRIHLFQLKIHNVWMKFFWNQKISHLVRNKRNVNPKVIGYIIFSETVCWYVLVALF